LKESWLNDEVNRGVKVTRLVFVDTGVLIAAARGTDEVARRAIEVLDDPDARFVSSQFVKLETLPKSLYNKQSAEADFYAAFFDSVTAWARPDEALTEMAYAEAVQHGLSALDALHVVAASILNADELVTTEGISKPLHRTRRVKVRTIAPEDQS
jgi:hypothetical protein